MGVFAAQQALYAALVASGAVPEAQVTNDPKESTPVPYIEIEDPGISNDPSSGTIGTDFMFTIRVVSEYDGNRELIDIYEKIRERLDGKRLAIESGQITAYVLGGPIQRQEDGERRIMVLRINLSQQENLP